MAKTEIVNGVKVTVFNPFRDYKNYSMLGVSYNSIEKLLNGLYNKYDMVDTKNLHISPYDNKPYGYISCK